MERCALPRTFWNLFQFARSSPAPTFGCQWVAWPPLREAFGDPGVTGCDPGFLPGVDFLLDPGLGRLGIVAGAEVHVRWEHPGIFQPPQVNSGIPDPPLLQVKVT